MRHIYRKRTPARQVRRGFAQPRTLIMLTLLAMSAAAVSGCRASSEPPTENAGPPAIKILVNDRLFYQREYQPFFDARFPDWQIELIDLAGLKLYTLSDKEATDQVEALLEREHPDLLITDSVTYTSLSDRELLRDLGPWISQTGIDEQALNPGLLDTLKNNPQRKLFGISPAFRTTALFYNKTMFREMGIAEPRGLMTWREVMELSVRFMQDKRMEEGNFGFHQTWISSPDQFVDQVAATEGLRFADYETGKVTVDTPEWTSAWSTVLDAYREGAFRAIADNYQVIDGEAYVTKEDQEARDLFSKGRAAMTTGEDDLMNKLVSNPPPFEWGVVAGPVSGRDPGRVGWHNANFVLAVPLAASRPELAEAALAYFWSEEIGQVYASADLGLSAYMKFPEWKNDPRYEVFYQTQGWPGGNRRYTPEMQQFNRQFLQQQSAQFTAAADGDITVEQALDTLQREGQAILDGLRSTASTGADSSNSLE